jgi:hypothetical protein
MSFSLCTQMGEHLKIQRKTWKHEKQLSMHQVSMTTYTTYAVNGKLHGAISNGNSLLKQAIISDAIFYIQFLRSLNSHFQLFFKRPPLSHLFSDLWKKSFILKSKSIYECRNSLLNSTAFAYSCTLFICARSCAHLFGLKHTGEKKSSLGIKARNDLH